MQSGIGSGMHGSFQLLQCFRMQFRRGLIFIIDYSTQSRKQVIHFDQGRLMQGEWLFR